MDDLTPLLELRSILKQKARGTPFAHPKFWPELSANVSLKEYPLSAIKLLPQEGFDIINPRLWDDCLERACRESKRFKFAFIEFSRGNDPAYCRLHRISPQDTYLTTFKQLALQCPWLVKTRIVVVALTVPQAIRLQRNQKRRTQGCHAVADIVMHTIYKYAYLSRLSASTIRRAFGSNLTLCSIHRIDTSASVETSTQAFNSILKGLL